MKDEAGLVKCPSCWAVYPASDLRRPTGNVARLPEMVRCPVTTCGNVANRRAWVQAGT